MNHVGSIDVNLGLNFLLISEQKISFLNKFVFELPFLEGLFSFFNLNQKI